MLRAVVDCFRNSSRCALIGLLLVCFGARTVAAQPGEDAVGWGFLDDGGAYEYADPQPPIPDDGWSIPEWAEPGPADDCAECPPDETYPIGGYGALAAPDPWDRALKELRFHHSSVDGRAFRQPPIHGTSWLNRPYHFGVSSGGLFMTQGPADDVRSDSDLFGAVHVGWDWDYFWGLEGRIGRATPEMINRNQPTADRNDALLITDISLLYYPSGDTVVRPYMRAGVGWSDFAYPNDGGTQTEVSPFTIPFGLGVKWPVKRWLAARLELLDNLAIADSGTKVQNNLTLVVGIEYRWGAKPDSYWPWNSSWHLR